MREPKYLGNLLFEILLDDHEPTPGPDDELPVFYLHRDLFRFEVVDLALRLASFDI